MWEQAIQPWVLRQVDVDLVHGPVFVGPMVTSLPLVVTIHDLSFLRFPHFFRPANRFYLGLLTRASVRRAKRPASMIPSNWSVSCRSSWSSDISATRSANS